MARGCGDAEDHAVLLCNLLIGFGLDAFVAVGTNGEGSHAWVLERQSVAGKDAQGGKHKIIFWESLHGQKMMSDDPRVHRFYRTVGCVFNNRSFFANIQEDDRVFNVSWDFDDEFLWKGMNKAQVSSLQPSAGAGYLMPSPIGQNVAEDEKNLERVLRDKIAGIRKNDGGNLATQWDSQLSYLLQTALANYEFERICKYLISAFSQLILLLLIAGQTFANEEFQASIKNYVPEGHSFKAFPIQFKHTDSELMIHHIF